MNRPLRPHMNFHPRPRPYNHSWRPNHGPSALFSRSNSHFGPTNESNKNNDDHWCETCDRGFPTVELLHKHKQQHQKCNIEGCQFIAHPKVITKHIQMQHSSGLYKKIANLNNAEEIQKWREERKKKYPTKSNIEKKQSEHREKIERGEKMALKNNNRNDMQRSAGKGCSIVRKNSFDKRNQRQQLNRQNFKQNPSISTNGGNTQPAKKKTKSIPSTPTTVEKNKLKPFTGILNIVMDNNIEDAQETMQCTNRLFDDDYDEEVLGTQQKTKNAQEPVVCGALTSLMCDYGTSDEEPDENKNEIHKESLCIKPYEPLKKDGQETPVVHKPELTENNESDDDGPEEVKIEKNNTESETPQSSYMKNKEKTIKKVNPPRNLPKQNYKSRRQIPSTLLQKLLHKEIRQERNIVLQCIRYIKKNNYFDEPKQ